MTKKNKSQTTVENLEPEKIKRIYSKWKINSID